MEKKISFVFGGPFVRLNRVFAKHHLVQNGIILTMCNKVRAPILSLMKKEKDG
jgi:hypothetical protein